ncbi:CaiB/BaiF CoA transferase family protein [Paraliomyxa miuraensis]|uniref:CaiB/BaiF CoA transferase family protein n=1 Tax=Paraliomyxa miuraensis TaxID=376150 RepID=UPI0022529FEE|nr:CoA transferase [Paraliomyxa miuraensis]MCX4246189.1 CoA transferase [Paraliomyxa miuraensis]
MSAEDDLQPPAPPLRGVRVLDFTQNLPGPYASLLLASMGAEVIKVEPPRGDTGRLLGRLFDIVNAGKKSIVLDLKTDADRARLHALLPHVDVLLEGFRPGVMEALGGGPTQALARNPRLVYCSMSGYGQHGPYREYPGHDLNFQALASVCHMMRDGSGHPLGCALPIADLSSGLSAVATIVAALYGRQRDDRGRHIDVALTDTVLSWAYVWAEGLTPSDAKLSGTLHPLRRWLDTKAAKGQGTRRLAETASRWLGRPDTAASVDRVGRWLGHTAAWQNLLRLRLHALPHYALYQCRDDRWISVGIVDEQKFWAALCEGLGLPEPLRVSMTAVPLGARVVGSRPLRRVIATAFRRHGLDHWLRVLDRAHVPVAPVLTLDEALADPQLAGRVLDPSGHAVTPMPFACMPLGRSPRLGEHTAEVMASLPPE